MPGSFLCLSCKTPTGMDCWTGLAFFFRKRWITNRMNRTRPQNTQYPRRSRQSCYPLCYMYTVYTTIRRRSICEYLGFAGGFGSIDWSTRQHWPACAPKIKRHRVPESGLHECQGDVRTVGIPTYVSDKMQLARMVCACGDGSTVPVRATGTCTRTCSYVAKEPTCISECYM